MSKGPYKGMTAPGGGGDPSSFPYMIEVNPWTPQEDMMKALLYRGAIVGAWGFVETSLSELAIRCSHHEAYINLRDKYPYSLDKKLAYLEAVFQAEGPLKVYGRASTRFIGRFRLSAPIRHMMAHGRMRILPIWGIEFWQIDGKEGNVVEKRERFQMDQLEQLARHATRLSRKCQRFMAHVDSLGIASLAEISVPRTLPADSASG